MAGTAINHPRTPRAVDENRRRAAVICLTGLMMAFLLRVAAQIVQALTDVGLLPPFNAWQSDSLPYPILLASQLMILALQAYVVVRVARGKLSFRRSTVIVLGAMGTAYFSFMAFRLLAGLTVLRDHHWFDAPLPSIFHIVLATFVLVTAWVGHPDRVARRADS